MHGKLPIYSDGTRHTRVLRVPEHISLYATRGAAYYNTRGTIHINIKKRRRKKRKEGRKKKQIVVVVYNIAKKSKKRGAGFNIHGSQPNGIKNNLIRYKDIKYSIGIA